MYNFKAIIIGSLIFIISQFVYTGVLMKIHHHEILRLILMATPSIAVFVSIITSRDNEIFMALITILIGAVISILSSFIYEYFEFNVDHFGGLFSTFIILTIYYAFMSIPGVILGFFWRNWENNNK